MFDEHSSYLTERIQQPVSPRPAPMPAAPPVPATAVAPHRDWNFTDFFLILVACAICLLLGLTVVDNAARRVMDVDNHPDVEWVSDATAGSFIYISVLVVILAIAFLRGLTWQDLGFRRTTAKWLAAAVGLGIFFLPVRLTIVIFVMLIFGGDLADSTWMEETESDEFSFWYLLGILEVGLMVGVFAPIVEELFFRGVLHTWLSQKVSAFLAIFLSGFLFGLAHQQPYLVLSNIIMGFVLSASYHYSKSLWVSMLMHFVNNGIVIVMILALVFLIVLLGA